MPVVIAMFRALSNFSFLVAVGAVVTGIWLMLF